jgi:hypothetical protein
VDGPVDQCDIRTVTVRLVRRNNETDLDNVETNTGIFSADATDNGLFF